MRDSEVARALRAQARLVLRVKADPSCYGDLSDLEMLAELQQVQAVRLNFSDAATTGWLRSVLLERSGDFDGAIAMLKELRDDRDLARTGTTEPGLRPYITGLFPALAGRLVGLLHRTDARASEIFAAIEWGKGRALADADGASLPSLAEFSDAISGQCLHYVTLMVDRATVYGMLVPARGSPVVAKPVELRNARALEIAVDRLRASRMERRSWTRGLEEVLAWMPAPNDAGVIRPGKVILVAPAGELHLLPLHGLPCAGGLPLAPRCAVVRVHGAAAVMRGLATPAEAPRRRVAVRVPCANDIPAVHAEQIAPVHMGMGVAPGDVLEGKEADADAVWHRIEPSSIVHFSTHGGFRGGIRDANPYNDAGIALANGGRLPTMATAQDQDHLFTPSKLERKRAAETATGFARLRGAHVTLQACVSGHARANPQGDAVGLEWALLLGGAASVLCSHWNVQLIAASRFCEVFYRVWLGDRTSRAEAWRRAVEISLETIAREQSGDDHWQAFTLSGAWA